MKTTLLLLSVFLSVSLFGQNEIITKDRQTIQVYDFIGKSNSHLYFIQESAYQTYSFKIELDKIDMNPEMTKIFDKLPTVNPNNLIANSMLKFSKQSITGITISAVGTVSSIILPFVSSSTIPVIIASGGLGIVGYIVWALSYRHLKNGAYIALAKEYN